MSTGEKFTLEEFALLEFILFVFVLYKYVYDKLQARRNRWRTSEETLLWFTVVSPVGASVGMIVPWHKIRKPKFWIVLFFSFGFHVWLFLKTCELNVL